MRKYFVVAYVIIGLLVFLVIGAKFDIKGLGALKVLRTSLRIGSAPDLDDGFGWLNTNRPLRLGDLKGKVVLLDFWTYCSVNCMHTLEEVKKLEAKYADHLVVIGVHSGKFINESDTENIRQAILKRGIRHPVVNDARFSIWHKYNVTAWPTLVLINPEGFVAGYYKGEGNYDEVDKKVSELITEFEEKGLLEGKRLLFDLESIEKPAGPLLFPGKALADEESNRLFIADTNHNRIVITDLEGKLISIAGSGAKGNSDGKFSAAGFNSPQGMAYKDNVLYVADSGNHLIRKLDLNGLTVETVAGNGKQADHDANGGEGVNCALNSPWDLTIAGNKLYIAMAGFHQIWAMDLATGVLAPFAGNKQQAIVDGPLLSSSLAQPSGIATDGKKLYIADSEVSSIRSADLDPNGVVESMIGQALFMFGDVDGKTGQARLQHPTGIASSGDLIYIADTFNHKIKVLNLRDQTCKTLLGTGKPGNAGGKNSEFYEPGGVTIAKGKLYIADTNNHVIKVADIETGEVAILSIAGL